MTTTAVALTRKAVSYNKITNRIRDTYGAGEVSVQEIQAACASTGLSDNTLAKTVRTLASEEVNRLEFAGYRPSEHPGGKQHHVYRLRPKAEWKV